MTAVLVTMFISMASGYVVEQHERVMADMTECKAMAHQHQFVPPPGPAGTFTVSYCKYDGTL